MSHTSASASFRAVRNRLLIAGVAVAATLGATAPPASAAAGVFRGTGVDRQGDAPSPGLDIAGSDAVYNRNSGRLKGVIRMAGKPPGDVDITFGQTQANGTCSVLFTLSSNVAEKKGVIRGSSGGVRGSATVSFNGSNTITIAATDTLVTKRTPSCAYVEAFGAGAAHARRDRLEPFPLTEQVDAPENCVEDECGTPPPCTEECEVPPTCPPEECGSTGTGEGVDTDGDGIPDDFDGDGVPDDFDGDGIPDALAGGAGQTSGEDGTGGAPQLSVRFYGIPKALRRGRSYEVRVRIRNDGDEDARKLKVRLAKKTGVSMSRRVASVSNVRAGKGVTVHIRVRLTSRQAKRTVRVAVTNDAGIDEQRSFVLRRRGAK